MKISTCCLVLLAVLSLPGGLVVSQWGGSRIWGDRVDKALFIPVSFLGAEKAGEKMKTTPFKILRATMSKFCLVPSSTFLSCSPCYLFVMSNLSF